MTPLARTVAVGVFYDQSQARKAVNELGMAGFQENQIGVVVRGSADEKGIQGTGVNGGLVAEGAVVGAAAGAGVGSLWS
jgi:hypothetical protein